MSLAGLLACSSANSVPDEVDAAPMQGPGTDAPVAPNCTTPTDKREKIEVTTHHEAGNPAKALVTIAEKVGADLIVVGNRGMKGLKGKVLGSVPNEVSHHASCAVLILNTTS